MSELIDNRAKRIGTLKQIMKQLHAGADPETVRAKLAKIVKETDAGEIAAMEQEIIADGTPIEEIKSMCDLHASVVQEILRPPPEAGVPPGHPLDTFRRENKAITGTVAAMRVAIVEIKASPPSAPPGEALNRWRDALNDLMDVDKHYSRKENVLFSFLERHGITGPSKVMWAKDDEARALLKDLCEAMKVEQATAGDYAVIADRIAEPALQAVEGMVNKEERILLPMALQTFTQDEWGEIWQASQEYGWCLVEPRDGYRPSGAAQAGETAKLARDEALIFPTGSLNWQQLSALFKTLPVDLTFVDADDRVRFYSEGPDRVFVRSKAVIGRKVQHCHPPKSVHIVDQIIRDFRAGRQHVAEFWIELQGRFIHIRYLAVRDEAGGYLGTLEVTQDITRLRALQGEQRLLAYEKSPTAGLS